MSSRFRVKVPTAKISRRMQRDHEDVLQNIEFYIQQAYRERSDVDDAAVREALVAHLNWREPQAAAGPGAQEVWIGVSAARRLREDVDEETWRDGLRTILRSLKLHSTFQAGETSYLDFVGVFMP